MRRLSGFAVLAACAVTFVGCATTMTVSSHVERGLDFSRYRSFAWGPADALPTGDPRLDQNPFFKDHVQGAVEKQLARRGLPVTMGNADLLVHYHANIRSRLDPNQADRAYGYCPSGDCLLTPTEYEAGTLVVDIVDARTNRLVWRGWAQMGVENLLHDPDRMAQTIDRAVTRMLQRLPPVQ
jgi:hypothetical protein